MYYYYCLFFLIFFFLLIWCINSGSNDQLLGTVDSYGHLIVSKLDATGKGMSSSVLLS